MIINVKEYGIGIDKPVMSVEKELETQGSPQGKLKAWWVGLGGVCDHIGEHIKEMWILKA